MARQIPMDQVVDGIEYKYWRAFLKDLTDDQLRQGRAKIADFDGYLTVGAFKKLCTEKPEDGRSYYNPYQLPAPSKSQRTPRDVAQSRIRALMVEHFGDAA